MQVISRYACLVGKGILQRGIHLRIEVAVIIHHMVRAGDGGRTGHGARAPDMEAAVALTRNGVMAGDQAHAEYVWQQNGRYLFTDATALVHIRSLLDSLILNCSSCLNCTLTCIHPHPFPEIILIPAFPVFFCQTPF